MCASPSAALQVHSLGASVSAGFSVSEGTGVSVGLGSSVGVGVSVTSGVGVWVSSVTVSSPFVAA